jgi:type IV secretory pathway VirB10-like protein
MWESRPAVQAEAPEAPAAEPEPVAPPQPEFVELTVPADAVIGLQLETTVSSDRARVEDAVDARVTRDVRVGGRVAIPAGSLVHGTVTEVERGGKVRERARLGIRFHTVVLANGDKLTLRTDQITREGADQGRESAAKIGGAAIGGAILGAILGGGKGAAIGAGVGAGGGGGTAAVMAGERSAVTIPAGSTVSVRVRQPVSVTVEKE